MGTERGASAASAFRRDRPSGGAIEIEARSANIASMTQPPALRLEEASCPALRPGEAGRAPDDGSVLVGSDATSLDIFQVLPQQIPKKRVEFFFG